MLQLLSKGNNNSEQVVVVSDYEKVEKLQVECLRLQSLDSGMCTGEEVSQESLEAGNISANESHDKTPEEKEGGSGTVDFQKLFGGSGSVFGKGSIQVCSDYEQVQKLQPESPELPSLDSGVSSGGEERVSHEESQEESHEESLEDMDKSSQSTHFLFPPPLDCSALPRSGISFLQQPLNFSGLSPSPSLRPSGDGYMPAKQEPCWRYTEHFHPSHEIWSTRWQRETLSSWRCSIVRPIAEIKRLTVTCEERSRKLSSQTFHSVFAQLTRTVVLAFSWDYPEFSAGVKATRIIDSRSEQCLSMKGWHWWKKETSSFPVYWYSFTVFS